MTTTPTPTEQATEKQKIYSPPPPPSKWKKFIYENKLQSNYDLYLLLILPVLFYVVFMYFPMYGVQIAFKDFMASKGIWGSPWVGFKHFSRFFKSTYFVRLLSNTLGISLLGLLFSFPLPILLALSVNELADGKFKKMVQNITYAPHFLSTVVIVGMLTTFLNPEKGIVNHIMMSFGLEPMNFMYLPSWFKGLYVGSNVWQNVGWSSIIYISALAGIDPALHEAAKIDGAGKLQRIWHVNLPGIMPTIVTLLILTVGQMMNIGFEKIFLMLNDLNMKAGDVISTYSYRMGIQGAQYSYAAAIGLFNSVINCILLITVNSISKKVNETSLF